MENGLVALENGRNYNEWLEQMKEDINWDCCERLTIDDLWEICQYVFYVWTADRKTEPQTEYERGYRQGKEDEINKHHVGR